ncbi:MAG: hypothetical protein VCA34_16805 [Roseibacillus sp.]
MKTFATALLLFAVTWVSSCREGGADKMQVDEQNVITVIHPDGRGNTSGYPRE